MHGNGRFRNLIFGVISQAARATLAFAIVFALTVVLDEWSPAQTLTTLHSFNGSDGYLPDALVQASDGNFYGTTPYGGDLACNAPNGCGTVFKMTPNGTLTTLHYFNGTDGWEAAGGLVQASDGNLYGITFYGGDLACEFGCGTVFKITPNGTLTTLHSFNGGDGSGPSGALVQASDGNFYGTTTYGGDLACELGCGTVFKMTPNGTLTTLHYFNETDGAEPSGALVQATDGNFYGTTSTLPGTVFKMTPNGTLTTLDSFYEWHPPSGALVQATDGNLYGTTGVVGACGGGYGDCGTVFKITPSGTLTTLYTFNGSDGTDPSSALVQATDGNFYGTTNFGGGGYYAGGILFKITPSGTLTTLYSFCGQTDCDDGAQPVALVQATDGNFYGTTVYGGANKDGTVFRFTPAGGLVRIENISMFDSHTLRVDVTAQFSRNPTTSKQITVNTNIEGVPLERILRLNPHDTGRQIASLFIDLAANNVPLFSDNQVFDVTATAAEGQQQLGTDSKTGEIPLPVVHIHGILTDCLGDRIPHALFQYLTGIHPSYVEDDGKPDGSGTNNKLTMPYPTLVSFDYPSLQQPVEFTGGDFTSFIEDELLPKTYASKVNVVAHSLGGIISRSAIVYSGVGPQVNKLVLVGSPTEGAAWASFAIANWRKLQVLLLLDNLFRLDFHSVMSCIMSGTQDTASELLPSYPWWATSLQGAEDGDLGFYHGYENPLLPALNAYPLDPRIRYYAIVASGVLDRYGYPYTSEVFWGARPSFWFYDFVQDWTLALGPGDGVVPIRSQLAADVGWPMGVGPGKLDIFDDVGDVFHTGYFDQFQVQGDIETILWPDGQLSDDAKIVRSSRGIRRR